MSGPEILEQHAGPLRTRAGAAFPGERAVFRGHDLHAELKHMSWVELYAFGITGLRFTPHQVKLLNAMYVLTSYPDARLWNNRVAALAGSARSTGALGVAAGMAATEARTFGWRPILSAADFLARALRAVREGEAFDTVLQRELRQYRHIGGYGRPVATLQVDERIAVLVATMEREQLARGPHLALAFAVEEGLVALGRRLTMNYAAVIAGITLDLGFTPRECYVFMQPLLMAGKAPCYLEALERPEGATFPLRCAQVQYQGPAGRGW